MPGRMLNTSCPVKTVKFPTLFIALFFSVISCYSDDKVYIFKDFVRKESVLYDKETDEKINGLVKLYSPASGKLFKETPYKDGKENGVEKGFSDSGNLYSETPYNEGKKNGVGKVFYESGKTFAETPYMDGKENGVLKRYYETGNIFGETPYKNGKIDGVHQFFYESGKLKSVTPFKNGKEDGIEMKYRESGSLSQEIKFENGIAISGYIFSFWGNKREMNESELLEINSNKTKY
jgi:antitoxin component YwqK of YwqJK toxin-antitoxin module